ncbi:MAG TPA: penicillin-binding transpeptidase domain-containing protein [Acidimicrobiales bacterium]|nr:penicillin-binding transpeptidase domain-containing protein [Acidimicrobiales bacterium]
MGRRLSLLAGVILLLFAVVVGQSINLQFFRAKALDASPINPRNNTVVANQPRGEIVAADGTILAQSVPTANGAYKRIYPLGSLMSGLVGFVSPYYGTWALEAQYNRQLTPHPQPPQSLAQVLAPSQAADNVVLTLNVGLERVIQHALAGRDGAGVVIDPKTGAVLAMYSNPTYNPAPFTSSSYPVAAAAWKKDTTNNAEGFPPLGELATQQTFPPGSTFKVVTTSAVLLFKPQLLKKVYPAKTYIHLPNSNKTLSNYAYELCGGTIAEMLPPSCDTGFAMVGLDLGGNALAATADAYGFNQVPPLDMPGVAASSFPSASAFTYDLPQLAYSSLGQQNVRESALMDAMIAGTVANGGVEMVPHLMKEITGPNGTVVARFKDRVWKTPLSAAQAAQIVPLMVNVAKFGTAAGIFPAADDVGAKTGTSQTGTVAQNTDDWLIAFAPASDPTVAAAVVVPYQVTSATGASVAGPIIACLIEGGLAVQAGQPAASAACPG